MATPNDPPPRDHPATVSILTTEHFTLQGARSATVSEANGRTGSYLATISGVLLALSFVGDATKFGVPFVVLGLVLGPTLIFLGSVTFLRVLESALEDHLYARAINRLRHYYLELRPDLRDYLLLSDRDDARGVLNNMALTPNRIQLFVTSAGLVGVLNSVVIGCVVGGAAALGLPPTWAFGAAVLAFGLAVAGHARVQERAWADFMARVPPRFPSDSS